MLSNHLYGDPRELKRTVQRFLRHIEEGKTESYNFPIKNGAVTHKSIRQDHVLPG
jgi:hypothetical protein